MRERLEEKFKSVAEKLDQKAAQSVLRLLQQLSDDASIEKDDDEPDLDKMTIAGRGLYATRPMFTLALLREVKKLTQAQISASSGIAQSELSKLERRETLDAVQLSTLRRYAKALGGDVQVVVVLDGRRYVLKG